MSTTIKKYLGYNGLSTVANKIKDRLEKVTTMPASPSNGDAVLYVGTTTSSYTNGLVYIYDSSTSSWRAAGGGGGSSSASNVSYDNTISGLDATNVQDAIDEDIGNTEASFAIVQGILGEKADIVSNPTSGNFAGLDANGNLTDSGHKHSDYLTSHQDISGKMNTDGTNAASQVILTNSSLSVGPSTPPSVAGSFAQGISCIASGVYSHAEGMGTTANFYYTHAEGNYTTASNTAAHAEGNHTTASGEYSHANGNYTTAGYDNQTVVGKYNNNKSTTLFEVGNGASGTGNESNAFEVYSDGNISTDNGSTKVKTEAIKIIAPVEDGTTAVGTYAIGEQFIRGSVLYKAKTAIAAGDTLTLNTNYETTDDIVTQIGDIDVNGKMNTSGNNAASHVKFPITTAVTFGYRKNGTSLGQPSLIVGTENCASSSDTIAIGTRVSAIGMDASAFGRNTTAGYDMQTVVGKWNDNKSTTLFEVGNGTGTTSSNAFEVYNDGSLSTDNGTTKVKLENVLTQHQDISGKADKVTSATSGNFAGLDANGNLTDSGSKASDFLTSTILTSTTISASTTSYTFSNASITADSVIDIYDTIFGFSPTNITVSAGSATVTFPAQNSSHTIKLFVY